jgi:hypothetical protein
VSKTQVTQRSHSELSPSSSDRWLSCPGSVALCRTVPKPPSSIHAKEGTTAHKVLEKCLLNPKINPYDLVGEEIEEIEVTEEMAEAVSYALDVIRADLRLGGTLLVEQKLTVFPDIYGHLDAAIVRELDAITVYDFKYGKGIIVSAADNSQLLLYLLALLRKHEANTLRLVIIQPRTEGQQHSWECSLEYMQVFEEEVKRKIALTQEKDASLIPGNWCRWCPAKIVCSKYRTNLSDNLPSTMTGKELVFPDVKVLSIEAIQKILDYKDRIEDWLNNVWGHALGYLESGGSIPGYELGKKRANRKWKVDEVAILKAFEDLGEKAFVVKPLSPAQMEKLVGKERVAPLVEIPDTGNTIKKLK